MSEIRFYHLQQQTLNEALPKLMEKVMSVGMKAVVKADCVDTIDLLDKALWDYDSASFLPHDKAGCDMPEKQTIYLTTADENPNDASVLTLINTAKSDNLASYDRCLYMFDGRDEKIVSAAREDWKRFKENDTYTMSYWQQGEQGGWVQKA